MVRGEIKNARITRTMLGVEEHGILSAMIYLEYNGRGQGFGGYSLDAPAAKAERDKGALKRHPHKNCGLFVARVLEVVGVEKWEDLKGQVCRADASYSQVHAIGNFLKEEWFYPEKELNED